MKNIIFPTDFSDNSLRALDWAIALAKKAGAKLTLFHGYHVPVPEGGDFTNLADHMEEDSRKSLDALAAKIRQMHPAHELPEISIETRAGFAVDAVIEFCHEQKADLVVMGTHGSTGVTGALLGSVASHMTSQSEIPVLIVPSNAHFRYPEEITIATDLRKTDFSSLGLLPRIASLLGSHISLVHVEVPGDAFSQAELDGYEKNMRDTFPMEKFRFHLWKSENTEKGIAEFIEEKKSGMLVMIRKKKNFFQRLFDHSHTRSMALHSRVPLLVFPEKS